jgi:hypothetical protein
MKNDHTSISPENLWKMCSEEERRISALRLEFWKEHHRFSKKTSARTAYHYTDNIGLASILKTGNLWLTEIQHLNDPDELNYGQTHIDKKILAHLSEFQHSILKVLKNRINHKQLFVSYSGSFSFAKDHLNQWTRYAQNGRGFALGFDSFWLEDATSDFAFRIRKNNEENIVIPNAFSVIYDAKKIDKKLEVFFECLRSIGETFLKNLPNSTDIELEKYSEYFTKKIFSLYRKTALTFYSALKHPAYRDEKEFRLLLHTALFSEELIKLRPRGYEFVPYLELNWKEGYAKALKEVLIGPSADKEKSKIFVETCLAKSGIQHKVKISYSKIPYRSF